MFKNIQSNPKGFEKTKITAGQGKALSCRAFPLSKQSAGLFGNSPFAERLTAQERFAVCGQRLGRCPRPATFFYEKKVDEKTCYYGFSKKEERINGGEK